MVMKMPMTSAAGTSIHQSLSDGARWPRPSMMASLHTVAKSAAGVPTVAQGSGDSGALFARPGGRACHAVKEGGVAALASDEADAMVDRLRGLWHDRVAAEEQSSRVVVAAAVSPVVSSSLASPGGLLPSCRPAYPENRRREE
uniref:Uncharacterized protein n=1 Tax=Oryza sativa subsp. japonica TaxID=39947 RepID=Q6Z6Q0_ORYSJ|nr:hypothetical protein [Oryza sativa Japonica Group]BAD30995.1 hypothetical protein [Oryza sativa Japonica Group]